MVESWLAPLLEWIGIGIVPFFILIVIIVLIIKS